MPLAIAIIGAGPSGFYTAAALIKSGLDCQIDMIESLPTPYGLIRGGVAPDHQSTKAVSRAFGKTAADARIAYFGNVRLGVEVSIEDLRGIYDAVILALGAPIDRDLGIPGADLPGVFGAAAFVGWYNGHPDFVDLNPDLNVERVCVVGNGNVALDVARVLVKTPAEMASSDLPDYAARAIHAAPIREVALIGRRGPAQAKFTNKELSELGDLTDCGPLVEAEDLPAEIADPIGERDRRRAEKNLATFRDFAGRDPTERSKRLRFLFFAKPVEVLGSARVEVLRVERTRLEEGRAVGTGKVMDIPCGLVVSAIGYRMAPIEGVPIDPERGIVHNRDGRIGPGFYVVGWAKRGPTGVIGTNKADGDRVADQIAADIGADIGTGGKPGRGALETLLSERGGRRVSFRDWQRIEAAEVAAAPPGAPRRKLIRIKDMLAILGQDAEDLVGKSPDPARRHSKP